MPNIAPPRRIHVTPAKGLRVINPDTGKPLSPEGATVAPSTYWTRRRNASEVTEGKPPASNAKQPKPKTAAKPALEK